MAEKGLAVAERAKQEAEGLRSPVEVKMPVGEGVSLREGAVPLEEEEEEEGYCSALTT